MNCRICGCEVGARDGLSCCSCAAPFHRDCWEFNGGCGIYGCGGAEATAFEEGAPRDGVIRIEEGTEPAFRLAPHVEALVRRLPRWGRVVVPPVLVAILDGLLALMVGVAVLRTSPSGQDYWIIWGLAGALVLTLTALAGPTRRRPLMVLGAVAGGSLGLQVLFDALSRWMNHHTEVVVGTFLFSIFATAGVLAEALVMRLKAMRRLGMAGRAVVHGLVAMGSVVVVSLGVLALARVVGMNPHCELLDVLSRPTIPRRLVFLSMFGLAAVAPTLVLAASPLMYRLKAEARREADEA